MDTRVSNVLTGAAGAAPAQCKHSCRRSRRGRRRTAGSAWRGPGCAPAAPGPSPPPSSAAGPKQPQPQFQHTLATTERQHRMSTTECQHRMSTHKVNTQWSTRSEQSHTQCQHTMANTERAAGHRGFGGGAAQCVPCGRAQCGSKQTLIIITIISSSSKCGPSCRCWSGRSRPPRRPRRRPAPPPAPRSASAGVEHVLAHSCSGDYPQ